MVAVGVALLVMLLNFRPHEAVVGSLVVPDGVEYAAAAQRLATLGRFDLPIAGHTYPSRYPPSFSALLMPAYLLRPNDFVAGIWVCYGLWAAGCATFAFAVARRFGGAAAFLIVTLINAHPLIVAHATLLLSDVPSVAALLAISAFYLSGARGRFAGAGVALAIGVACRSTAIGFCLPFLLTLRGEPRWIRRAVLLLAPALAVTAANGIYNRFEFGSFAMNGYVYWCAMPYSRFDYIFNANFVPADAAPLLKDPWIVYPAITSLLVTAAAIVWERRLLRDLIAPIWLAVVPVTVLYLFYFFVSERFFLPLVVGVIVAGAGPVAAVAARRRSGRWLVGAVAAIVATFTLRAAIAETREPDPWNALFTEMRDRLPRRCRLITMIDPIQIEAFVTRGTDREWIAAAREADYVGKVVTYRRMDLTGIPQFPTSVDRDNLIRQGARFVVPETAEDDAMLNRLADPAGPPVFIDGVSLDVVPGLRTRLSRKFTIAALPNGPQRPLLFQCVPRLESTSQPTVSP